MATYWRSFRGFVSERFCRALIALMSINDPQWGKRGGNQGPPDLDELMRNFNRKIGAMFGRKGDGGGSCLST